MTTEETSDDSVPTVAIPRGKRYAPWVYEAIQAGRRYHFKDKIPWRHNAINLGAWLLLWGALAAVIAAGSVVHPAIYVPIGGLLCGLLYFALFVLVVHEASHGMFVISANKDLAHRLNRAFGWSVAVLFAVHYDIHWARGHREHHLRPLEPSDPQRFSLPVGGAFRRKALQYLLIPGFMFYDRTVGRKKVRDGASASTAGATIAFAGIWATLLPLAGWATGGWPVPAALFWGVHVVAVWNLAKGGLEHGGAIGKEPDPMFRTRTSMFFGRRLIMPFNISLHFEHHLNFTVPWYDLLRYQRDLQAIVPPDVWRQVINTKPLDQLAGRQGGLSEQARALTVPAA